MSAGTAGGPGEAGLVVVTSRSFSSGSEDLVARLASAGLRVARHGPEHDLATMAEDLREAVAWIAGTGPVRAQHLAAAPRLRVLARYGVGVDAVDLAAADEAGVVVTNTPGANSAAVVEHTLALVLAALRGVAAGDRRLRAGDWSVTRGRQLGGARAGVVGFGRIGRAVAERLRLLGAATLVHDPYVPREEIRAAGHEPASLGAVRAEAEIVSLHLPGGRVIVDEAWTRGCPAGQVLVNTARADLVDEAAVAAALHDGRLGAFAADTLAGEGDSAGVSPLLARALADRVTLTPHLGAQTTEAVDAMGSMAVEDVLAVLGGRPPLRPVEPPAARAAR